MIDYKNDDINIRKYRYSNNNGTYLDSQGEEGCPNYRTKYWSGNLDAEQKKRTVRKTSCSWCSSKITKIRRWKKEKEFLTVKTQRKIALRKIKTLILKIEKRRVRII